ncbi:MAG TPA: nuclear transport factor 2 family protein [Gaiellaceae bacterium]|nr:nuclear transport factor 2 family protein [Gaiellaceae bacterium]
MTVQDLVEAHVRAFNHGVREGDWEPMLARFADDATLRFENAPAGPFQGIDEIRRAYRETPPDDELVLLGVQADERGGSATAAFAWSRGGTGRMAFELDAGRIRTLTIAFDP